MSGSKTVVVQSFRTENVPGWVRTCLDSVADWALRRGYAYDFIGDEIFDRLPAAYRERIHGRPRVGIDLARLISARRLLGAGWDRVIWLDADVLVFAPDRLSLDVNAPYAFGSAMRVRRMPDGTLSVQRRIHNAVCVFRRGNPVIDFYIHACQRIVERASMPVAPNLVGSKLLGALYNLLQFKVITEVGFPGPLVGQDLIRGGGPALNAYKQSAPAPLHAMNLGNSMVGHESDGVVVTDEDMSAVCDALLSPMRYELLA